MLNSFSLQIQDAQASKTEVSAFARRFFLLLLLLLLLFGSFEVGPFSSFSSTVYFISCLNCSKKDGLQSIIPFSPPFCCTYMYNRAKGKRHREELEDQVFQTFRLPRRSSFQSRISGFRSGMEDAVCSDRIGHRCCVAFGLRRKRGALSVSRFDPRLLQQFSADFFFFSPAWSCFLVRFSLSIPLDFLPFAFAFF